MNTVHTSLITLVCLGTIPARGAEETRFRADEWQMSAFPASIDKTGSDDWGGGGSVSYFLTKNLGLGGTTYWSNVDGLLIDNLAAEGTYRLPLLNWLAPYAVGGLGYEFEGDEWFATLGAGIDFRPFDNLSVFSDAQWRFANETQDGIFLRLGVRFSY